MCVITQESKAEAALEALESMAAPNSEVIRDGQVVKIPSNELVPGDVVILDLGARVPADIRLIETQELKTNESALTGDCLLCLFVPSLLS